MLSRLKNSCKPEHEKELLNVQPQLKDMGKHISAFHRDLLMAIREIGRWQVHQEPPVQNYLTNMAQYEEQIASASGEYAEGYDKFAEFWGSILDDHRVLMETERQHEKAVKRVEKDLKHKIKAETKDEPNEDKVADETFALQEAQAHEQEIRQRLHQKKLEYEKNLHKNLRMAYFILHSSRLRYYEKCMAISQRAIKDIEALPTVKDLREVEFEYEPYPEPLDQMARAYWPYGDTSQITVKPDLSNPMLGGMTSSSFQPVSQSQGWSQPVSQSQGWSQPSQFQAESQPSQSSVPQPPVPAPSVAQMIKDIQPSGQSSSFAPSTEQQGSFSQMGIGQQDIGAQSSGVSMQQSMPQDIQSSQLPMGYDVDVQPSTQGQNVDVNVQPVPISNLGSSSFQGSGDIGSSSFQSSGDIGSSSFQQGSSDIGGGQGGVDLSHIPIKPSEVVQMQHQSGSSRFNPPSFSTAPAGKSEFSTTETEAPSYVQ